MFELLAYKQLTAPVGAFGKGALEVSTVALASGSPSDDSKYLKYESRLTKLTARRDALASQIKSLLDGAEFHGVELEPRTALKLTSEAESLLRDMDELSGEGR